MACASSNLCKFYFHFWDHNCLQLFQNLVTLMITQPKLDKEKTLKMHTQDKLYSWAAECIQCNLSFNTTKDLKIRFFQHHSCNLCGYSTIKANHLKRHMMVHSGEKPFACKQCNFSRTQAGTLKTHMLTHIGETNFSCALQFLLHKS